jgi:hypothetical protein
MLSHLKGASLNSKWSPIRGTCGDVQIRCDPIDAIGSHPPMPPLHSPLQRNPRKTPYTKNGHTLRPTPPPKKNSIDLIFPTLPPSLLSPYIPPPPLISPFPNHSATPMPFPHTPPDPAVMVFTEPQVHTVVMRIS